MQGISVTLPHGFAHNGSWLRRVLMRPLSGGDERFLAETGARLPTARRTSVLLARLVRFAETGAPLTPETIRKLTAGDREALLLHLCRNLYGERLSCMLCCPECSEAMTLDLAVCDLLVPTAAHPAAEYHRQVAGYQVVLRPVTNADLEGVEGEESAAGERLLRACVVAAAPPLPATPLPSELADALSEALSAIDPQADLLLGLGCSACGRPFQASFDPGEFFRQGMTMRTKHLEEEVHAVAFYYHWTEDAILSLPLQRRRRYVEMIAGELAGRACE
jgi:hypothetical protein